MSSAGSQTSLSPIEGEIVGLACGGNGQKPPLPVVILDESNQPPAKSEKPAKRKTQDLKFVPATAELRARLRTLCVESARGLERTGTPTQELLESEARRVLSIAGEPEKYLGWTMVVLASEFWRGRVAGVPYARRLLLLPRATKPAPGPADAIRARAERLGYRVLCAEDSAAVLECVFGGRIDAIVGTADLDVLEKALDKILLLGMPCMAVPLLHTAGDSEIDTAWLAETIEARSTEVDGPSRTYVHLLRAAARMFEPDELERLVPRLRGGPRLAELNGRGAAGLDPIAGTEAIAFDFLARGGKHSRPFITLAVYDALTGGHGTDADGDAWVAALSPAVLRTAMSIETFHKASLVHDDIEDDDAFRYGEPTLHRKFGVPTAINVGDFLIGLGYRLVSRETKTLGAEIVADILDRLADAHLKLSEGQGAELLWRDSRDKRLTPTDALRIYALKTAPAFEAALFSGFRLAGSVEPYQESVAEFAKHLGMAFQILNDLGDWRGDDHNKLLAAGDITGGRPTILWALALEGSTAADRERLQALSAGCIDESVVREIRELYERAGVLKKAEALVEKSRRRAEAIAAQLQPESLRALFVFLIQTVLAKAGSASESTLPNPVEVK